MSSYHEDNREREGGPAVSEDFDRAVAVYTRALIEALPWTRMLHDGVIEAKADDEVLAAVSKLTAEAPSNLSVNRLIEHLSGEIVRELCARLQLNPTAYVACIRNAQRAAMRHDASDGEGEGGGEGDR